MPVTLPETLGPYRILGVLGVGGMGSVLRAEPIAGGAPVALKSVTVQQRAHIPALRREVYALSRLDHPGIVRIKDSGTDGGVPWIAMELVEGPSLREECEAIWGRAAATPLDPEATALQEVDGPAGPTLPAGAAGAAGSEPRDDDAGPRAAARVASAARLPGTAARPPILDRLGDVLTIVARLCSALAYMHGEGMIHRDLKPANVLLAGGRTPVIVDFGLLLAHAREPSRDRLRAGDEEGGTGAYMAPEQIRGDVVDARADLYALGCVLYELLTGRPPFLDRRRDAVLRAHLHRRPVPPSELVPGLPPQLDELVLRLLAKQPRDRLGYASDVAARLVELGADPGPPRGPRPRSYVYRPQLAGRDGEQRLLQAELGDAMDAADRRVIVLLGESGAGKTRLALEIARWAERRGARVLAGECAPLGASTAPGHAMGETFGGLAAPLQAIADHCRAAGLAETQRILGGRARLLARYEPSLAELAGPGDPDARELSPEALRALVLHEVVAVLDAMSAGAPLLLVLDDLQWADDATMAVLERLASDAPAAPRVSVVATARREELGAPIGELLARPRARSVELGRLDGAAVEHLVSDMLALTSPSPALLAALTRDSEGNPFFLAELVRAAVEEGLLRRDAAGRWRFTGDGAEHGPELPLPHTVHALLSMRFESLGDEALRVARAAAVIGREPDAALLAAASGAGEDGVMRALPELSRRRVLSDAGGTTLRFCHDKIREVLYDTLDDEERAALHRRIAVALDGELGARAGEHLAETVAHHFLAAGEEARALPLLLAIGHLARQRCDNARAEAALRRALAILAGPFDPAVEAELVRRAPRWREAGADGPAVADARRLGHLRLGEVLTTTGRYEEALAELGTAERMAHGGAARAAARSMIAQTHFAMGELHAAKQDLEAALRALGAARPASRAAVIARIAGHALRHALLPAPAPAAGEAARAVERLRVRLLNRLAYVHYSFDMERTYECHLAALAAAERIPDTAEAAEAFSHHGPVAAGILPARARRFTRRAIRVCREHGHVAGEMQAQFMAGIMFVFQARWSEAIAHFGEAIALYPSVGDVSTLETAHENLAYAHLYRGDHEAAVVHAERALSLSEQVGDRRGVSTSLHHLATAELRLGHVERADRLARDGLGSLAALHDDNVHVMTHALAARVARAKGLRAEAARAIERAVRIAATLVQEETTYAHWELAEIYLDLEALDRDGARRAPAMRALGKARRLARRFPAHEGPVLRVTARVLAANGELERARPLVLRAAQVLADRGMRHELGRTWEAAAALLPGDRARLARDRACELYRETGAALDAERARTA